jgi:hypothetical protein
MDGKSLFDKIGAEYASDTKTSLLVFKSKGAKDELHSLDFISRLKPDSIYISVDKSLPGLRRDGVDLSRLTWIDASGKYYSRDFEEKGQPNIYLVEGPSALHHLSAIVARLCASGEHSFLVFDSLDGLMPKNRPSEVLEFADYLGQKAKSLKIGAIFATAGGARLRRFRSKAKGICGKAFSI